MKKIILFIIAVVILTLSSLILYLNLILNNNNYAMEINNSGFIPKIEVNKTEEKNKIKLNLNEFISLRKETNGIEDNYIKILLNDNSEKNTLEYSFYGEYTNNKGKLFIKEKQFLNHPQEYIKINLQKDLADFNSDNFIIPIKVFNTNLQNIDKLNTTIFKFDIVNLLENKTFKYDDDSDNEIIIYDIYEPNDKISLYINKNYDENQAKLIIEDVYNDEVDYSHYDNSRNNYNYIDINEYRYNIYNDGQGIDYEFKNDKLILKDIENNKEYIIPKGEIDEF